MTGIDRSGFSVLFKQKSLRSFAETMLCIILYAARRLAGRTKYEQSIMMANAQKEIFDDIYTMY